MDGIWLAIGFILSSTLAVTVIPSLPVPFAYTPLLLAGGIVVMNRVRVSDGALWIVLSGIVLSMYDVAHGRGFSTVCAAIAGMVLAERVFAKRSVYALLGLGATTGGVFVGCEWIRHGIAQWLNFSGASGMSFSEAWWTWFLLLAVVYCAFVGSVTIRRVLGTRFLVR